jgi:1-acyl-sn-glycerol-3-phosphate acyltransferase
MYFFGFLVYSLPFLRKVKELPMSMSVEERDRKIHEVPKRWARDLVNLTGSTVTVKGAEHIPEGPILFVSNHQGNFDIPVLMSSIEKPFGFISKMEVKKIPLVPKWMEVMNCVFIDRSNRRQSIQAIKDGIQTLKDGHSLVIFPEGTRSKGGPVSEFKGGGLRMAFDANVPIVPVTINGTYKIMEQNKFGFTPAHVEIILSKPFVKHMEEKADGKEAARLIRETIVENLEKTHT